MKFRLPFLGIAILALCANCTITELCGCPPALGIGTVAGVVRHAEGTPAPGALVRVDVSLNGCNWTTSHVVDPNSTITGPSGTYRYEIRAHSPSDTACLRLTAVDTATANRDSVSVASIRIRLIPSYGTRQRPESLRVDLRLP